jgi:hypothetical protein
MHQRWEAGGDPVSVVYRRKKWGNTGVTVSSRSKACANRLACSELATSVPPTWAPVLIDGKEWCWAILCNLAFQINIYRNTSKNKIISECHLVKCMNSMAHSNSITATDRNDIPTPFYNTECSNVETPLREYFNYSPEYWKRVCCSFVEFMTRNKMFDIWKCTTHHAGMKMK